MQQDDKSDGTQKKFRCPACNEHMTYGCSRCDSCNEEAPIYNRRGFWLSLWIVLGVSSLGTALPIFS